jgi:hypothetical protein
MQNFGADGVSRLSDISQLIHISTFYQGATQIVKLVLFSKAAVACRAHSSDGAAIPSL